MREPDVGYAIDRHLAEEERDELIEEDAFDLCACAPDSEWDGLVAEAAEKIARAGGEHAEWIEDVSPGLVQRLVDNEGATPAEVEALKSIECVTDLAMEHYRKVARSQLLECAL